MIEAWRAVTIVSDQAGERLGAPISAAGRAARLLRADLAHARSCRAAMPALSDGLKAHRPAGGDEVCAGGVRGRAGGGGPARGRRARLPGAPTRRGRPPARPGHPLPSSLVLNRLKRSGLPQALHLVSRVRSSGGFTGCAKRDFESACVPRSVWRVSAPYSMGIWRPSPLGACVIRPA